MVAKRIGEWWSMSDAPTTGIQIQTYPHYRSAYWDEGFNRWVKKSIRHSTVIPLEPQPTHWQHHSPPPDTEGKPYIQEMLDSGDAEQIAMAIMMQAEEGE